MSTGGISVPSAPGRPAWRRRLARVAALWRWLWQGWHIEHSLASGLLAIAMVMLALVLTDRLYLYGGDIGLQNEAWDYSNRLYLLSSIAQSLAAILALVLSLTLVATQLAAQTYSPRVVHLRMRDPWLWGAVTLYAFAILWALLFQGWLEWMQAKSVSVAILLAGAALGYLVPFTLATLRSLDPVNIARSFANRGGEAALDDMLRRAINESMMSVVREGLAASTEQAVAAILAGDGEDARADAAALEERRFRSIGRHACQRQNIDAFEAVQHHLGLLMELCTDRRWRGAANTLNGVMTELDDYAAYCFGGHDD